MQTLLPPDLAEWVKGRAEADGVSIAAWFRALVSKERGLLVRAWVPDTEAGEVTRAEPSQVLEHMTHHADGTVQFRVWEADGFTRCRAELAAEWFSGSVTKHGLKLDGSIERWSFVCSFADATAEGQLIVVLRSPRASPAASR